MEIENITKKDIEGMDYNQLIGLTKETNRLPGGRKIVFEQPIELAQIKKKKYWRSAQVPDLLQLN